MPITIKTDYPVATRRRSRVKRLQGQYLTSKSRRSYFLTFAIVITCAVTIWIYLTQHIGVEKGKRRRRPDFDYDWILTNDTTGIGRNLEEILPRQPQPFCKGIFQDDPQTMRAAAAYMKSHPRHGLSDDLYYKLLENCDTFIRQRGYIMRPLSEEEENFPLAYDIVMYDNVEQTERLLRAIYMPQNYYCIHVDKKAKSSIHQVVKKLAGCFPNVFIASQLVSVRWGTMSVLQADLNCMEDLMKFKKWRYFINLTGQEMPLKSNRELVRILKVYNGANEIEAVMNRFKMRYAFVHTKSGVKTNIKKGPPPHDFRMAHGAVHVIASRDFVEFALRDRKAKDLKEWLEDTFIPDELFFSSLNSSPHLHVPGAYTGPPANNATLRPLIVRYKLWSGLKDKCYGYWQRGICIFSIHDLPDMIAKPHFFVNKFVLNYDYLGLDCLEELVYNKTILSTRSNFKYNVTFYENLDHVKHHVRL